MPLFSINTIVAFSLIIMYHYIYMIKFNTGQFYIGSRTSKLPPEQDTKYWGSPKTFKHLWEDVSLEKKKYIIKNCKTIEKKRSLETKLIKEAWKKYPNLCLNRSAAPAFHPETCSEAGKIGGRKNKEQGLGIFSLTKEQRIENGKKYGHLSRGGRDTIQEKYSKEITLKSPSGEIITTKNIRKFCRDNNLDRGNIYSLLKGRIKTHKGWSLPK